MCPIVWMILSHPVQYFIMCLSHFPLILREFVNVFIISKVYEWQCRYRPCNHVIFQWPVTCDSISMQWEQLPPMGCEPQGHLPVYSDLWQCQADSRTFDCPENFVQIPSFTDTNLPSTSSVWALYKKNFFLHMEKDMASFQVCVQFLLLLLIGWSLL